MKKIIVLFLLLVSFQLFSDDDEKPKLAVMEFDDLSGKLSKNMLSRATELIRSKFVASNKFIVIAKERQEKAMIKEMKKESYKACNDKNCQIPLGQALSADTILRTTINFFGGTYTITSELIDLEKEATVQGAEAAFNGTEKSLNAALNDIVKQIIVVRTAKEENMPVASSQDKRACEYARNEGNLETWEEYLAAFPNGECSFEAKSKIRKLKKEEENTPKTCVQKYKKAAEQGNAEAQHKLGNCYYNGEETAKDYYEAFKWYKLSAEKGYMYAERSLGYCYEYGEGTAKDYNEAFKWYKKSADKGNAEAQVDVGLCYEYGKGMAKDFNEAFKWYKKAAEQGNMFGQRNLGNCYYNGWGTAQDYNEAFKWYKKAAEQDFPRAWVSMGYCYETGHGVAQDYYEAFRWYKKAAEKGYDGGMNDLGRCYYNGSGTAKDYYEAFRWYKKAAEKGNMYGQYNLAWCYEYGLGTQKDLNEAQRWYKKAAEQGHSDSQEKLKSFQSLEKSNTRRRVR